MNKRRKLVIALGASMLATPFGSFAQQLPAKIPRVGYLGLNESVTTDAFRQGMRELGYVEGRNVTIDYRFSNQGENEERLPGLAAALAGLKPDVLVAGDPPALRALMGITKTVPIVMRSSSDPVASGIVASLAHPGGNITGVISLYSELNGKRMELLKEAVPAITRLMLLRYPRGPEQKTRLSAEEAASRALGLSLLPKEVHRPEDFENAFKTAARERANGLLVIRAPIMNQNKAQITGLAARARLPAIYDDIAFAEAGGLMSYGANLPELHRHLATFVDKILKGAKPGDIPVEQPTKFELVVNMKTAKALGIKIPQTILVRADKMIE